ncbi:IS66 family transposase [Weissella confusa]|uniref:IS66 family transposase n=1 Tax=Weissella confusa TaxID=1583 RepID=UPI003A4E03A6
MHRKLAGNKLRDYNGIIQSEVHAVYQGLLEGIINANCWAHARRKFMESAKDAKNGQA